MEANLMHKLKLYNFLILFTLLLFTGCEFLTTPSGLTDEEKLEEEGYTLLELDDVSNIWYKNIEDGVTSYIQQDEIDHNSSYYLDLYFYIDVVSTETEPSLVIKTRTKSESYYDMFVPNYVVFQTSASHNTSDEGKIKLIWGNTEHQDYNGTSDYFLWCESNVLNNDNLTLNNLIEMLDTQDNIYYYFEGSSNEITNLKSLSSDFQERIRDTLYTFVNYKDELIYR